MQWRYGIHLILLVLAACAGTDRSDGGGDAGNSAAPEGSIQAGDGVYMRPVGPDETGCEQYTAWSDKHMVTAMIQFRRADGSFTALRNEAACPPLSGGAE